MLRKCAVDNKRTHDYFPLQLFKRPRAAAKMIWCGWSALIERQSGRMLAERQAESTARLGEACSVASFARCSPITQLSRLIHPPLTAAAAALQLYSRTRSASATRGRASRVRGVGRGRATSIVSPPAAKQRRRRTSAPN